MLGSLTTASARFAKAAMGQVWRAFHSQEWASLGCKPSLIVVESEAEVVPFSSLEEPHLYDALHYHMDAGVVEYDQIDQLETHCCCSMQMGILL